MLTPSVPGDLSVTTLNEGLVSYFAPHNHWPVTLVVSPNDAMLAYEIVGEIAHKLIVVVVPGFPRDAWMLCGIDDIFYSKWS